MMNKSDINRFFSHAVIVLVLLELLVVIVSWTISSVFPETSVRSLLSGEGIRWLFGRLVPNLQTPLLLWILLLGISFGVVKRSGLQKMTKLFKPHSRLKLNYRERVGRMIVVFELLVLIGIILLLTCVPHAILLSVSGELFPSSFSGNIVPVISFLLIIVGTTYGLVTRNISTVEDWFYSMTDGICDIAPVFVIYVFLVQLISSICFVWKSILPEV